MGRWVDREMISQVCCPSTPEKDAGGLGNLWLHTQFESSLGYVKSCLQHTKLDGKVYVGARE